MRKWQSWRGNFPFDLYLVMSGRKTNRSVYGSGSKSAKSSYPPSIINTRSPLVDKTNNSHRQKRRSSVKSDYLDDNQSIQSSVKADPSKSSRALSMMMSPVVRSDDEDEDMDIENGEGRSSWGERSEV